MSIASPTIRLASAQRTGFVLFALGLFLLLGLGCEKKPATGPSDVILLVVDTLRAQNLSLYGYSRETSPHLETFSRDAVVFENAITPGTWTVPAHASLLTGRWPSFHGAERVPGDRILALPISPEVPTLAEILLRDGWRTGGFVANSTYLSHLFGFERGFQRYIDDYGFVRADEITEQAGDWLASEPGKAFLFVNILDPHEPFEPKPPFDTRFPGRDPAYGTMFGKLLYEEHRSLTPEMLAHFVSQYDGEIAFTDEALGRFFDRLRKLGRYDSALIFVTADHGELLGERGLVGHGIEPLEPLIRVPLLVKYPGNRGGGTRVQRRVSTMSFFATVFQTLGLSPPTGMQAFPVDQPHDVYVEDIDSIGRRVRVAYDGARKLVIATGPDGKTFTSVYDLERDPNEEKSEPASDSIVTLRATLDAFAALPRPVNVAERPTIDAEREAKLRALGYVR